jgi:hypothetical protein
MADGTVVLIFDFAAGDDFHFLSGGPFDNSGDEEYC